MLSCCLKWPKWFVSSRECRNAGSFVVVFIELSCTSVTNGHSPLRLFFSLNRWTPSLWLACGDGNAQIRICILTARFCGTQRDTRTVLFAYVSFMPLNFSHMYSYLANSTGQTDKRNVTLLNWQALCIKGILMSLDICGYEDFSSRMQPQRINFFSLG